jgi:hypothetical protein
LILGNDLLPVGGIGRKYPDLNPPAGFIETILSSKPMAKKDCASTALVRTIRVGRETAL